MKILMAEDNATSGTLLGAMLEKLGHNVAAVRNGEEAWEAFQEEQYPLLISGWRMPGLNGLELCRRVRAEPRNHDTYILLLTAPDDKANLLDAMDAGADDFLAKPFEEDQVAARLRIARHILNLQETLHTQTVHDSLTGVLNRAAILEDLRRELDRAAREGTSVGVVLASLDNFKGVNDTYGHLAGDAALREAARRIRALLRSYDKIGRYGGEEFLIVAPGCDACDAAALAERIRKCIGWEAVDTPVGILSLTGSLGVVVNPVGRRTTADTLVRLADVALCQAKEKQGNCIETAWEFELPIEKTL